MSKLFRKYLSVIAICFCSLSVFGQTEDMDKLREKLPRVDGYKLTKAQQYISNGNDILSALDKSASQLSASKYYRLRIEASFCFRNANGLIYEVINKHLTSFHDLFKETPKGYELTRKTENIAFDSLVWADKIREEAETEFDLGQKMILVNRAEVIEKNAFDKLVVVLISYIDGEPLNNSQIAGIGWKKAGNKSDHNPMKTNRGTDNRTDSLKHLGMRNSFREADSKLKNGEQVVDSSELQKVSSEVVNSAQQQWHQKTKFRSLFADTAKTIGFKAVKEVAPTPIEPIAPAPAIEPTVKIVEHKTQSEGVIVYKVQLVASRMHLNAADLKKYYKGNLAVSELIEDSWYKYSIGQCSSLDEAWMIQENCGVKAAFVVSYQNGKRLNSYFTKGPK